MTTATRAKTDLIRKARIWRTSDDPVEMVRLCGGLEKMDQVAMQRWAEACFNIWDGRMTWKARRQMNPTPQEWLDYSRHDANLLEQKEQAALLRCCVPPPFREQLVINPCWLTTSVIEIAKRVIGEKPRRLVHTPLVELQGTHIWRDGLIQVWLDPPFPEIRERIDLKTPDDDELFKGKVLHGLSVEGPHRIGRNGWMLRQDEYSQPIISPRFDIMPYLADALMDAGCDDAEMIEHCRAEHHCAGCWVLEAIASALDLDSNRHLGAKYPH